jgi:glycosyltransferase involved in cell wall biosynthesis
MTDEAGGRFPVVSLILLTYNQQDLVEHAVAGCFAQDCEPIEIVLSDDCSTDDTFARLQTLAQSYRGPHTVIARRNARNLGISQHYNQLVTVARGELLVTAAGDDVSTPDRVRRIVAAWEANGRRADLIASHVTDLDQQGNLHEVIRVDDLAQWRGLDDWLKKRPYIIGASHAFTRRMMDRFGPFIPALAYEDQTMAFRAIVGGGAITVDASLVHYRRGGASSTRPGLDSVAYADEWTEAHLNRTRAEIDQRIADADVAGCGDAVRDLMAEPLQLIRFLQALRAAPALAMRFRAVREAPLLPLGWRLRKLLHATFPNATFRIKRSVRVFHRRYWRERRAAKSGATGLRE